MLAKMPLLINSRMTSAGLTPRSSARSLTVMLEGSSIALRSSEPPFCDWPPCVPRSRRGGLRGPRRPRVPLLLLATITSYVDLVRLPCKLGPEFGRDRHFQRSLERSFVERRGSALWFVTQIGPTAWHLAGRVDHDPTVRHPHDPQQLALLLRRPADDARPCRKPPRRRSPGYGATSPTSSDSLDLAAFRRFGFAGSSV